MLALLLLACATKSDGSASALLRTDTEPVGNNCAEGGVAISSGTDDDGDGVLSDAEVDTTVYVCNGADGEGGGGVDDTGSGTAGSAILTTSDEPAGDNCAYGGVRLDTGVDDDGDGALDEDEIDDTEYVCDGAPGEDGEDGVDGEDGTDGSAGTNTLATVTEEPEGANCAYGGQRVDTGADVDGDGTLDDDEILSTAYVCNGSSGEDGADALVSTSDEPAGANCADGGLAVSVGSDDDGDGALDSGEVDSVTYVCDGEDGSDGTGSGGGFVGTMVVGDYTVANSVDAALLDGVEEITGTLTIYGASIGDVSLPDLQKVGALTIGSSGGSSFKPDSIDLPALTTVSGALNIYYTTLSDLSGLDSVETIGGTLSFYSYTGATTLDAFPNLSSAGGITLSMNSTVTEIAGFDGLTAATGTINISSGSGLTTISGFSNLVSAGDISVGNLSALTSITGFSSLTSAEDLTLTGSALTSLAGFGALETLTGTLTISNGDIVDLSDFSSLSAIGGLALQELSSFSSLYQLSGITSMDANLSLIHLVSLTNLTGLNDLTDVGGTVTLQELSALTDLTALGNLTEAGNLSIADDDALTSLTGLVLDLPDTGTLSISNNLLLSDLSALSTINGALNRLYVYSNGALSDLDGLDNISSVGSMTTTTSSTSTYIQTNAVLTNLDGLYGITALGYGAHQFQGNATLCNSVVTALYTNIGASSILGTWSASGNKSGC